jgi:hypothetical protein
VKCVAVDHLGGELCCAFDLAISKARFQKAAQPTGWVAFFMSFAGQGLAL